MRTRRNLIIVIGHGLRSDALGDGETWPLRTPNFEKLLTRGLRTVATSASVADDGALVSLLTGLHARQHGHVHPTPTTPVVEGWPAQLAAAGYHLVGVGRTLAIQPHLHQSVTVDELESIDSRQCQYLAQMNRKGLLSSIAQQRKQRLRYGPFEPDRLALEPEDDVDGFIAAESARLLEEMPDDKPWALIVLFTGPGSDLPPPMFYDQVVEPCEVDANFIPADLSVLNAQAELDYPRSLLQRLDRRRIAQIRSDYLGRVSLIDYGMGRIMSALQQRQDASRTWMIATSDRGCLLGEQGLVGHRSFLTPAVEVPVLIVPPTPPKLKMTDDLISTIDVAATVAALAGCDMPTAVTGRSLLPLIAGEPMDQPSQAVLCEFGSRLLLETDRHKLIFDVDRRKALGLYDLLNDPDELHDILTTPLGRNLLDALRWRLGETLMPLRAG
ncbi:MAG: sulfatase-like hydrolase/transferase [Phycisphaeraceae bacterium]|nr:sulfatase-like hydrolase/transferase [Phycisphaeraceae bacterium]